ncbi:unnamed protein product, partial [Prorocentrum cordatum]
MATITLEPAGHWDMGKGGDSSDEDMPPAPAVGATIDSKVANDDASTGIAAEHQDGGAKDASCALAQNKLTSKAKASVASKGGK